MGAKMDKDTIIGYLIGAAVVIVTFVLAFSIDAWMFNAIVSSDMPDWLKYVLLK